jgi:hypothetical protein
MSPFIQQCLSRNVLKSLIKTGLALDYNKAIDNVAAFYRSAVGPSSSEVQIPLPQGEKPRVRPDELTDVEIEQAILPLFDYFDANLQTLNTYLSDTAKEIVMSRVWKEILTIIEGLLVPPLSDISSDMKPLSDKEVDIVFKWLKVCFIRCCRCRTALDLSVGSLSVLARLFLCKWGRTSTAGNFTEPEIQGYFLHTTIL